MIEFCGNLSKESKKYLLQKNAKVGFAASLITAVFFGIVIILIAAIFDMWLIAWSIIGLAMFVILAVVSSYMQKKKTLDMLIPKKICIDDEGFIDIDFGNRNVTKTFADVKKVVDAGEWYYIVFYFPKIDGFLCQKDLIVKGTLENFEKLFEGKIVRKK